MTWVLTWLGAALLKRTLSGRLKGDAMQWLQQVGNGQTTIYNRVDLILQYCKGKKVLHIGFADHPFTQEKMSNGTLLHLQLKTVVAGLNGIDAEQVAINEYIKDTGDADVLYTDIMNSYPPAIINGKFDVILFSEVLEHLKDPYAAVDILFNSFGDGTKVLVTVPNYASLDSIAASFNRTESIHPHHYWYFSPYTLVKLFNKERFLMEQMDFGMYYQSGVDINPFLKQYPYNGDCIIAVFSIIKTQQV